jgi:hypothetical protein
MHGVSCGTQESADKEPVDRTMMKQRCCGLTQRVL